MTINNEPSVMLAAPSSVDANHTNGTVGKSKTSKDPPELIAICGLAMRLPGGIRTSDDFWDVLFHGKDMRGPIPSDRYNAKGFNDALGNKGAIKTNYGYFLKEDLSCLDTSFFTMTKNELDKTDPQQRQLLEVTRECLENSGETNYRGRPIGCYVGNFGEDWLQSLSKENQHHGGYAFGGDLMIANRVSYEYDLIGPSMVIKTGCSASLVALHEACRALQSGDCTGAIVAGTNLIMGPMTTAAMTEEGILSPEGSCKTFDAAADGFARGEAINAVYIKRLDDAIKDGNPIRAVIRNTGTNSDGKSQGLMTPNAKRQEALMRKVYSDAGLDIRDTAFVECHGTATPTGDPIETTAVGNVFGEKGVFIGSIKPNLGHSEGASGLTSLIKAVLALENQTIPPNIKFTHPNTKIPFKEKHLRVPVKATPWPKDRAERVSINSFGIGGTNSHVILDSVLEVRPDLINAGQEPLEVSQQQLLLFSANTQDSLQRQVNNVQQYLAVHPERLSDLAYTLALRREHLLYRAFSVVGGTSVGDVSPSVKAPGSPAKIVMVFTGQGSQWPEMASRLLQTDPEFRKDIMAMDDILRSLKHPPPWTIENELQKSAKTSQLHRAELAQPICTAVQIGLVTALSRCNIRPDTVIGHSSGEIAAAYAAQAISATEAMIVAYYRGYVTKIQRSAGGMAAIGLDAKSVSHFLKIGVIIACENSPNSTTISGDLSELEKVIKVIKDHRPDVFVRQLKVDIAYHSHHMNELAHHYLNLLQQEFPAGSLARSDPKVPFFSTVTGRVIEKSANLDLEYWVSNLTSPVRFNTTVSCLLLQQPKNIFLEIGPHSTLAGPLRQICAEAQTPYVYVPTMLRSSQCDSTLLAAVGQLYQQGIKVNFESMITPAKILTDLPHYPWDHTASYWYESRVSKDWRFRNFGHHVILGQIVPESTSLEPCWRIILALEDAPWLYDHKVGEDVVFPFAGYISMAGEAIRQITGSQAGYSVRHVVAHTALVLTDSKPTEIVTTLRRHKLTDSTDSDSYDFVITSYSGSAWIKHCDGLVKPMDAIVPSSSQIDALPRKVLVSRWYENLARIGLVYGPEFQGVTDISSSTVDHLAVGEITNTAARQEAPFLFHPAAIDACFQLAIVAIAKGEGRNFRQLCVPTVIEELDISRSGLKMTAKAWSSDSGEDIGIDCFTEGMTALRLRGIRLNALDNDNSTSVYDQHAATRLEWCPDFDFMDIPPLFSPPASSNHAKLLLEELTLLCILDSAERLKGHKTEKPHFNKFRNWLHREIHRAQSGTFPVVKDAASFVRLSRPDRLNGIEERFRALSAMESIGGTVATGIMRICENAEGLFTGSIDTLELLMENNVLTEIYNAVSFGHGDFVRMLSNTKPNLRILEVGAGTGGTTELILRDLVNPRGNPSYSIYTFTDISAGFFPQAKERFSYASNMDYKVFDISQSPFEQGFTPESYDLILAPNVIHATPSLQDTLRNLRPLLRPHGHLVLSEVCAVARGPGYVFGNFSGWWLGEADGRRFEPYVTVDRWDHELKEAGFTGANTAVYDAEEPYQYCAVVVTQPKTEKVESANRPITLLCDRPHEGISQSLIYALTKKGITVSVTPFGDLPQPDQDIISTLDLETHFFENITMPRFLAFQNLIRKHKSQKLLWLLPPTQVRCINPRSAQSIGMIRTARAELAIPFMTLEIDPQESEFSNLVMRVFQKVCNREDTDNLAPDKEFVVDKGTVKIGRYQPFSLVDEVCDKGRITSGQVKMLEIVKPGLLETLRWADGVPPIEILQNQVEIETRAAGLNFRDIVFSMGVLSFGSEGVPLGVEVSGVVRRVGSDVRNVAVGNRVIGVAYGGVFKSQAIVLAPLAVQIPDEMSFEDAASMPGCYVTVIQSLIYLSKLQKGQSVLIHSACGGVGHAAIQICRMIGAEIFTTVGSEPKVQYLMEKFNIPRNRIFHSRNDSFRNDVKRETRGRGVDVVLNSLSGELLHASWKCVAEFGTMIELGKRDLAGFGKLDLEVFLPNRSFCCVDIGHAIREKPVHVGRILHEMIDMWRQGAITAIHPISLFSASEVEQSFRHLQQGNHIGKAVVVFPKNPSDIPSVPIPKVLALDPEASYLLTGGLGGIGRSIATWMIEHGARHLVFLSRSAGSNDGDKAFFVELDSMGCSVTVVAGKVQDMGDVKKVMSMVTRPIKGVIHLAMVLRDAPIVDMTYEEWTAAITPKVDGAWNLHNAFLNHSLDFFIMTSSNVTLVDEPGQSNYCAANTFLESFCQYRRHLGLPASVVGICPIDGVGFVADNPAVKKKLKSQGFFFLGENELLDYMNLAILNSNPPTTTINNSDNHDTTTDLYPSWKSTGHLIMGLRSETDLDDPNCHTSWRRDRRMGMYHNIKDITTSSSSTSAENSNALKTFLARAADEPELLKKKTSADYLAREVGLKVFKFMLKPEGEEVDLSQSLANIGMDSLMAIELRRWWKQVFGLDVSVLEIMGAGSLEGLGGLAAEGLRGKLMGIGK